MKDSEALVLVVDDDDSVRKALARLMRSVGLNVETFGSAGEFLAREPHPGPACLILDVRMPGLSGLDLQKELAASGSTPLRHFHDRTRNNSHVRSSDEGWCYGIS